MLFYGDMIKTVTYNPSISRISAGQPGWLDRGASMLITRGFKGRGKPQIQNVDRLPPGQHLTTDFPVLTAGPTQHTPVDRWSFSLEKGGRSLATWSWADFGALPQTESVVDIHCVTRWTKFDTRWRGVSFDDLLRAAGLEQPPNHVRHGALRWRLHDEPSNR